MTDLMHAHRQWANRPDDQRFGDLVALQKFTNKVRDASVEQLSRMGDWRVVETEDDDIVVVNSSDEEYDLTNWSFGQMCSRASAPAGYLRNLPANLVARNLNHGIATVAEDVTQVFTQGENVKAWTSERYGRVWNADIVRWLREKTDDTGWKQPLANPPGIFGAPDPEVAKPGGLYASDRDMFVFLIDEDKRIQVGDEDLARGFFLWNSEVGAKSFGLMTFLYRFVCGNNIVWGAENISQRRVRHVGDLADTRALNQLTDVIESFTNESAKEQTEAIKKAMDYKIDKDAAKVVEWIRRRGFTKDVAKEAVENAILEEGGAETLWQVVQGLTAVAREIPMQDKRTELEFAASKLLRLSEV
jgi:hypothetical protein